MAQFDVYENGNMETSELNPYLLDVQPEHRDIRSLPPLIWPLSVIDEAGQND